MLCWALARQCLAHRQTAGLAGMDAAVAQRLVLDSRSYLLRPPRSRTRLLEVFRIAGIAATISNEGGVSQADHGNGLQVSAYVDAN